METDCLNLEQNLKIIVLLGRIKTVNTANKDVDNRNNPKETIKIIFELNHKNCIISVTVENNFFIIKY